MNLWDSRPPSLKARDQPEAANGKNPKSRFEFDRKKTLENQGLQTTLLTLWDGCEMISQSAGQHNLILTQVFLPTPYSPASTCTSPVQTSS